VTPDPAADPLPLPKNQPPSTAGMTTKVVKGSLWTLAGQIAPMLVAFVATPFTIRFLGSEGYGVLILIGLIPQYFSFADFGMGLAATKFGSEAYGRGDDEGEARTVRTAALIALCSTLPVATAIFVLSPWIAAFFNVPAHLLAEASLALRFSAATLVLGALGGILNAPQLARLRMDINSLVNAIPKILMMALTPVVLYFGGGLLGAVLVGFFGSIAILLGHVVFSSRLLPHLAGLSIAREQLRPLLIFGAGWLVASAAIILLGNMEKFLLAKLTDVQTLAHYSIAATLALMATMLPLAMTQSLVPAFSQLSAAEKHDQLRSLFSRSVRLNALWLLPAIMLGIVFAKPFLNLWVGEEFANSSSIPFYVLLVGVFVNVTAYVPWAVLISSGKTGLLGRIYLAELFVYSVFAAAVIWQFGIVGAAAAWSIRIAIDGSILFLLSHRFFGTKIGLLDHSAGLALAGLVLAVPLFLRFFYYGFSPVVVAASAAACVLYALVGWKLLIGEEERAFLAERFVHYTRLLRTA